MAGAQIGHLKLQHSGAIGRGFGFNNLQGLSAGTFSGLSRSRVLSFDMSHGFLAKLGPLVFSGLPELRTLHLLRVLDLSQNSLNIVWSAGGCVDVFHHLDRLTALNLSRNNLQTLPEGLFQGLVSLQALDLSGNLMAMLPDGLFWDLHSLQLLGLQGNPLVALSPSVLQPLQALAFLNLQEVSLICHCSLWDLEAWLHSTNVTLSGGKEGITCIVPTPPFPGIPLLFFIQSTCVQ
uniref:Uncharacterized protein n=1 Tax=Chelydra serpentina TaxID=8475 RepID=A0A8C3T862_CHESE